MDLTISTEFIPAKEYRHRHEHTNTQDVKVTLFLDEKLFLTCVLPLDEDYDKLKNDVYVRRLWESIKDEFEGYPDSTPQNVSKATVDEVLLVLEGALTKALDGII